jgi:predicted outer membrane lipoprotein
MSNAIEDQTTVSQRLHRANVIRDTVAGVLVTLAVLLPWNIATGVTIAGTPGWVMGLLIAAALGSLAALVLTHVKRRGIGEDDGDLATLNRLRITLNSPMLAMVLAFLIYAMVEAVRAGGTATVPPGMGPGAWLAVGGALLGAAPVIATAVDDHSASKACRIIGIVSLVLAVAATAFNLYWRTRFVLPEIGNAETGTQNLAVTVAAVFYAVVALLPVIITSRWLMSTNREARLATVLLAGSALVAGVFAWLLPIGRDLDAFHGIAQNTSTAGVGFEGYLAWVAGAGVIASVTVLAALNRNAVDVWRSAARKCLVLIAVWCGGSALLRIVDLMMAYTLDLPAPPYYATTLMAFDLIAAVVAAWLFLNSSGKTAPRMLLIVGYGVLFVLAVCRVIVGVALVPRVQPLNPDAITEVYGNTLDQQITSTFDVALCVLGAVLVVIAFVTSTVVRPAGRSTPAPETAAPEPESAPTTTITTYSWPPSGEPAPVQSPPTIAIPSPQPAATTAFARPAQDAAPATAKISRPDPAPGTDRVAKVLAESTQRFAAGTTYGGGDAERP